MKFSFQTCVIVLFASLIGVASCKKLDDEPEKGLPTLISRLYISFSDYRTNNSIKNLMIVDPADTNTLDNTVQYLSPTRGGGPVLFDPNATSIFQASSGAVTQDTFIQRIPLDDIYGNPGNASQLGFTGFRNVRGLAYYTYAQQNGTGGSAVTNFLLAATGGNMLYAISRPEGKGGAGGSKIIDKQISLGDIEPASLTLLQGNPADKNEKWVLIGFNDEAKNRIGFAVYKGLKQELIDRARDTIINKDRFEPALTVYVEGKKDLRAVSYAPNKKLFAVTAGQEVLFFRNPDALFSESGNKPIVPDYVVAGSKTGFDIPQGIAIDDRVKSGKFFYVSDYGSKKVLRFNLTDQGGDIEPELTKEYGTLTPNYIFLDAREATNF
ncbi:hypothetical protein [Sphingobacterium sp. BIGb0165]|uniref:hypothetical protein n=1 Tax=Sphingobacterium sp. BIGb0165 TaxID=2940615 RepID=UPI002169C08E|nr:hypothetical protein [Sphingobacterium sp. BIGb0165]MCS4228293.1 hypothetical protein [Sphingobacterium sp. BIGb0165]